LLAEEKLMISLISGLATGMGGVLAAVAGKAGVRVIPALLGLSSGIGFTVVFFDLLPQSFKSGSWQTALGGMLAGLAFGKAARMAFPHLSVSGPGGPGVFISGRRGCNVLRTGYLFALGVAMHNLPEGLSIGAGLETGKDIGLLLAAAIGFHNIPEGMALCGILAMGGVRPIQAMAIPAGAGLMLPLGTMLAGLWMEAIPGTLSFILALGAGTLLYIIMMELIPESLRMQPTLARAGIAAGALLSLIMSAGFQLAI